MGIKNYKPTSPGRRGMSVLDFSELTKIKPEKTLLTKKNKNSGRNNQGKITVRGKGGGHKRKLRIIDFKRTKDNVIARVAAIEYDPNRSANIALLHYIDGTKKYIIAPLGLKVGDNIISGENIDIIPGNTLSLKNIPIGTYINNVELVIGKGGQIARAAGASAQIMAKEGNYAHIKMPSGEIRLVNINCRATVGQVGNIDNENVTLGKAGRSRYRGIRPKVRGIAMNACDHPHGGGEGRAKPGHPLTTPWGMPTKGYRTRKNKRTQKMIVRRRK